MVELASSMLLHDGVFVEESTSELPGYSGAASKLQAELFLEWPGLGGTSAPKSGSMPLEKEARAALDL